MLQIGCPKAKLLSEKINGLELDGIKYEVLGIEGLTIKVNHNAKDDNTAKATIKKFISTVPELQNMYTNIQMIDENGTIL